ncbi:MAG: hypothetical protein R3C56_34545 [Pirellulaceae bacterium]
MVPRRDFVFSSAALSAAATAAITNSNAHAQSETNERTVRVGVMGLSRGQALATGFNKLDGVEVAWVCDVDGRRLSSSVKQLQEQGAERPRHKRPRTSATCWPTRISTHSSVQLPITGTHPLLSWLAKPASTSMSKNRVAIIHAKENG